MIHWDKLADEAQEKKNYQFASEEEKEKASKQQEMYLAMAELSEYKAENLRADENLPLETEEGQKIEEDKGKPTHMQYLKGLKSGQKRILLESQLLQYQ